MNQISSRFSLCRSSLLRKNPGWTSSLKPISSSSLVLNSYPTFSSYLITVLISKFHHLTFDYHSPQILSIPDGNHIRKFSGKAAEEYNFGDDDDMKDEIWEIKDEILEAQENVQIGDVPPSDAVKDLSDLFYPLMKKLRLDDNKKARDEFRKGIAYIEEYADMTVAYGEFVAAGGDCNWYPFMSHYRRMLRGESNKEYDILEEGEDESADENYLKILASLRQLKIRSRLMKRLIKAKSDS